MKKILFVIVLIILFLGIMIAPEWLYSHGYQLSSRAVRALEAIVDSQGRIILSAFTTNIPANRVLYTGSNTRVTSSSGLTFDGSTFTLQFPFTVGQDDTGYDVKHFGDTSGKYELWDASEDKKYIVGAFEVGDLTNYTRISNAGAVSYGGSAKPTECVYLRTTEAYLPAANPATLSTVAGANLSYQVLDFDDTTDESVFWDFQVPAGYDGGNATAQVYWFSAAATTGNAQFDLDYRSVGNSDAVDGAATDVACTLQTTDGTAGDQNTTNCSLTTPFTAEDVIRLGLRRDVDASDDLVGDARVRGCRLCWSLGS